MITSDDSFFLYKDDSSVIDMELNNLFHIIGVRSYSPRNLKRHVNDYL